MTYAHGDRNRYLHGPDENDQPGKGCRCRQCRNANNRTQNKRRLAIGTGRHQPMVDAQPVREHVLNLKAAGLSYLRVAELAGVSREVVRGLLYGKPTSGMKPTRRMKPDTAAALLAVRADQLPSEGWVSAAGTRRRLQALAVNGWSNSELASRVGVWKHSIQQIVNGGPDRRVDVTTARAVRAVYDDLWDVDPATVGVGAQSITQTKKRAAARGWAPPMAWDDDAIDDPGAAPEVGESVARYVALAENADELIGQGLTVDQAAGRLGVSRSYVEHSRRRAAGRGLLLTGGASGE